MNEASVGFSGMGKGLQLLMAGGEDSLQSITITLRGVVVRDDFQSTLQMGSGFEAGFPVVLAFT